MKYLGYISIFILHFLVLGYPIQSFLPFVLSVDSNPINVGFRMFFLAVSILLVLVSLLKDDFKKINVGFFFFISFWVLYGSRLIYDLEVQNLRYLDTDPFFVYSFAFGVCLISSLAVFKTSKYIDHIASVRLAFWILLISNICLLYAVLSFGNWNFAQILLSRATVSVEIGRKTLSIVNPITIGFHGMVLAGLAVHNLSFPYYAQRKFKWIVYFAILLGLANLILGASRGPILSFVIILLFEAYLVFQKRRVKSTFILKIMTLSAIIIISVFSVIKSKVKAGDVELINRLSQTAESRQKKQKEERYYEWASAWKQFKDNPVIGDAFVTTYDKSYSHNLFLDVLMSTGLVGMSFFMGMLYFIFDKIMWATKHIRRLPHFSAYTFLFLAQFLLGMTSGGLFLSIGFWLLSATILGVKKV